MSKGCGLNDHRALPMFGGQRASEVRRYVGRHQGMQTTRIFYPIKPWKTTEILAEGWPKISEAITLDKLWTMDWKSKDCWSQWLRKHNGSLDKDGNGVMASYEQFMERYLGGKMHRNWLRWVGGIKDIFHSRMDKAWFSGKTKNITGLLQVYF